MLRLFCISLGERWGRFTETFDLSGDGSGGFLITSTVSVSLLLDIMEFEPPPTRKCYFCKFGVFPNGLIFTGRFLVAGLADI